MPTVTSAEVRFAGQSLARGALVTGELSGVGRMTDPFFKGRVGPGDLVAAGLLVVARTARARFVVKPGELASLDPVLTVDDFGIHVESLSDDGGVHARLSLSAESLRPERWQPGTVNVDFNEPMRAALASTRGPEPLSLAIGRDAVGVATTNATAVERRVKLPDRWVRGFAEVQVATAGLPRLARLDTLQARRTLRSLPRGQGGLDDLWGHPSARALRLTRVPGKGAIWVSAPDRIRLLDPLARHVRALTVYGHAGRPGVTAWAAELGGAQLVLTLSSRRSRGFTGEGGILYALADPRSPADARRIQGSIGNRRRFNERDLAVVPRDVRQQM